MNPKTILTAALALLMASCNNKTAQLYRTDHYRDHQLTNGQLDSVRQFLLKAEAAPRDTIIIKYDFNNETCWDRLDEIESDEQTDDRIQRLQDYFKKELLSRPNVSLYQFREPGKRLNKIKSRSPYIRIDSTNYLKNLFFTKRATCGSSVVILPTGRYLLILSDSHLEAFQMEPKKLDSLFSALKSTRQ